MQIVFISWWWPYPQNNGSKIRIYHLLRQLSAAHEVTLLSFAEADEATPEQIAHLRTFCQRVEAVPKPQYQPGSLRATLGYLSRWPRSLIDVYSETMARQVQVASVGADVLIASQLQTLRYLEAAPHLPGILEEIEVTGFYNAVEQAERNRQRLRAQMTLSKLENALRHLMQRGVALTVVSEAERDYIRRFAPPGARIEVIPNGVDTQANQPDATLPQPDTLIYPGAVTYSANYDAVAFFIREVLPLVRQRIPGAQFTVTGGTGQVDVSDLAAQPGVRFTGYLPEVAPAVRASWATVVPLRQGGGTRLKILESMALGTPVIATRKGAEGLNARHGEHLLLADEPQALAEAVCTLLNDTALRARLARAARALVEQQYDWTSIGRQLVHLSEEQASQKVSTHG
jgi:glycosyltransferase involved in cell wall biosynthesis